MQTSELHTQSKKMEKKRDKVLWCEATTPIYCLSENFLIASARSDPAAKLEMGSFN